MQAVNGKEKKEVKKKLNMAFGKTAGFAASVAKQRKKDLAKQAKKADEAIEAGPLLGLTVRCLAQTSNKFWQNAICKVTQHNAKTGVLRVALDSTGTERELHASEVVQLQDGAKEKPGMAVKLDLRRVTEAEKKEVLTAGGAQIQFVNEGEFLEGPELAVGWHHLFLRGGQSGDRWLMGHVLFLEPHSLKVTSQRFSEKDSDPDFFLKETREQLSQIAGGDGPCLVCCPINGEAPMHWACMTASRQAGGPVRVRYFDSLPLQHEDCRRSSFFNGFLFRMC